MALLRWSTRRATGNLCCCCCCSIDLAFQRLKNVERAKYWYAFWAQSKVAAVFRRERSILQPRRKNPLHIFFVFFSSSSPPLFGSRSVHSQAIRMQYNALLCIRLPLMTLADDLFAFPFSLFLYRRNKIPRMLCNPIKFILRISIIMTQVRKKILDKDMHAYLEIFLDLNLKDGI